jgi:hypothetical protein
MRTWLEGRAPELVDDQKRFLRQYCGKNSKVNFLAGVMALYRQFPVKPP